MSNHTSIKFEMHNLVHKCFLLKSLDANKVDIDGTNASGFIIEEPEGLFLYTCWHVVTGYNMDHPNPTSLPNRKFLKINLQNIEKGDWMERIGGKQEHIIPLYSEDGFPVWIQDKQNKLTLDNINLNVPFFNDTIKIKLPDDLNVSEIQIIKKEHIAFNYYPIIGDKVHIVGYPYEYSIEDGVDQPTPIVLTRHIAGKRMTSRVNDVILDGIGAPGISGGPVFTITEGKVSLFGIYKGAIYPNRTKELEKNESTGLGIMCNMDGWWSMNTSFIIKNPPE